MTTYFHQNTKTAITILIYIYIIMCPSASSIQDQPPPHVHTNNYIRNFYYQEFRPFIDLNQPLKPPFATTLIFMNNFSSDIPCT